MNIHDGKGQSSMILWSEPSMNIYDGKGYET